jgi:hypothetical protein
MHVVPRWNGDTSFMPVLGFMEQVGETDKNTTEPKRYRRDYYRGITRGGYGATSWFPARIAVTGPEAYMLNSVGVCTSNTVKDGWRTQVWQTDHPAKILNIVCGRWSVKQGEQSTVYYYPGHKYNVDEISSTLDAARHWYSQWFTPYPWRELKLSEFPGLAGYAQGFGTDITFSENIGFLTRNTAQTDATFLVTAHETAHQWWGNIVTATQTLGNANLEFFLIKTADGALATIDAVRTALTTRFANVLPVRIQDCLELRDCGGPF